MVSFVVQIIIVPLADYVHTDKAYEESQKYKEGKYILEKSLTGTSSSIRFRSRSYWVGTHSGCQVASASRFGTVPIIPTVDHPYARIGYAFQFRPTDVSRAQTIFTSLSSSLCALFRSFITPCIDSFRFSIATIFDRSCFTPFPVC